MSIILISAPAFSYVTNSSHCDNDVLSTYSGSANLTANWQGNPITVTWYNGDTQYDSNQCTYGGNLTMPSSIPSNPGYTFKGWRVRQCSLSGLDTTIDASWDADHVAWQPINGSSGKTVAQAITNSGPFQLGPGTDRSSELNNGEWAVTFSYGTIKGMAKCSETNGSFAIVGVPSDTTGQNCWCAATSYIPSNGSQCSIAALSWVLVNSYPAESYCTDDCAFKCSYGVRINDDFRGAVFGVSQ